MSIRATDRSRLNRIKPEVIRHTKASLQDLPEKATGLLSLQEAIYQLQNPLKAALSKGYTYQELAVILRHQGISISESTLKNYLAAAKQPARKNAKKAGRALNTTLERSSHMIERSTPRINLSAYNVGQDFWEAYQASLQEREEVYRRLANS